MSILDSIFGHAGHYVGMEYHAPGVAHVGCPYCKQPARLNAIRPAMPVCQEADLAPDPDAAKVRLALAVADVQRAIDNVTLAIKDDPRLDEALDLYRERLRGIRAALECEARP